MAEYISDVRANANDSGEHDFTQNIRTHFSTRVTSLKSMNIVGQKHLYYFSFYFCIKIFISVYVCLYQKIKNKTSNSRYFAKMCYEISSFSVP